MPTSRTRVLTVKISPELERRLELAARRRRIPKSAVMRTAIERFLDEEASPRSFGAEAADLAGVIDAASDLSYDKRHLRGYGR